MQGFKIGCLWRLALLYFSFRAAGYGLVSNLLLSLFLFAYVLIHPTCYAVKKNRDASAFDYNSAFIR